MIKSIEIQNFRTHQNTRLDLHSGVNVIVGMPDSGKTNITRALDWALNNRPLGHRMQSNFTDDPVSVCVTFEDDQYVRLTKSKKSTVYDHNGDAYEAVGSSVPDVISKIANMDEINLHRQLDAPFLICSSAGEVARVLNQITHLEDVDKWTSVLTSLVNSESRDIRLLESQVITLQATVPDEADLLNRAQDLGMLENLSGRCAAMDKKIESLERQTRDVVESCNALDKLGAVPANLEDRLRELDRYVLAIDDLLHDSMEVERVVSAYQIAVRNLAQAEHVYKQAVGQFMALIRKLDKCPFCEVCTTPISEHSFYELMDE